MRVGNWAGSAAWWVWPRSLMRSPPSPTATGSPLVRDAAWSLVGEGTYAVGLLLTAMVLARLGSVEALGQYTLGLAIATPAILLTNLHLRPAYVVDEGGRFADYLGLRRATIPLALALTGVAAGLGGYDGRTVAMVLAVGGLRAWESLSDILLAPAQRARDPRGGGTLAGAAGGAHRGRRGGGAGGHRRCARGHGARARAARGAEPRARCSRRDAW
jgi:hypothetical protein